MAVTLSIILPTFQAAGSLEDALISITKQRFENFEVLIQDGGSTDDTIRIAQKYMAQFPRIRLNSEPDRGIYDAMNKGIARAQGEWIYFLGSDDVLGDPGVLQRIFTNPANLEYDVLYGQVLLKKSNSLYLGEFDARKLIFRNISHQALFVRKGVFEIYGKFDLTYKICADHIFNVKWFFDNAIKRKFIDEVIANFGDSGISSRQDDLDKIRDLPGVVKEYGGLVIYFRFYIAHPPFQWIRKKLKVCKKLLLRYAPIII